MLPPGSAAAAAAKPAAVCLGVALLASVSLSRSSPRLWSALQQRMRFSSASGMSTTVLRGKPGVVGDASVAAEYLRCVRELENVSTARLSKHKITVVQVQSATSEESVARRALTILTILTTHLWTSSTSSRAT